MVNWQAGMGAFSSWLQTSQMRSDNKLGCHQKTFSMTHETMVEQSFSKKEPLSFWLGSHRDSKKAQPHECVRENVTGVQLFHRFNQTNRFAGLENPNPYEGQSRNPATIGSRTFSYDELDWTFTRPPMAVSGIPAVGFRGHILRERVNTDNETWLYYCTNYSTLNTCYTKY